MFLVHSNMNHQSNRLHQRAVHMTVDKYLSSYESKKLIIYFAIAHEVAIVSHHRDATCGTGRNPRSEEHQRFRENKGALYGLPTIPCHSLPLHICKH